MPGQVNQLPANLQRRQAEELAQRTRYGLLKGPTEPHHRIQHGWQAACLKLHDALGGELPGL